MPTYTFNFGITREGVSSCSIAKTVEVRRAGYDSLEAYLNRAMTKLNAPSKSDDESSSQ